MPQHASHPRDWRRNLYVYPVISRRSEGLSIGINLKPDTTCNFNCVYCQVDRTGMAKVREVDVDVLGEELSRMIADAKSGALFNDPAFASVPAGLRAIKDIAFSGDGEPTTCERFAECVKLIARLKRNSGLGDTKIVLITNACYLTTPEVAAGLSIMDRSNGQVWAKLDAGTEERFRIINRPSHAGHTLGHVIENIISASRVRPVVIQSMFLRLEGRPPDGADVSSYVARLGEVRDGGGRIDHVQVYTVARKPAQRTVEPLTDTEVDHIADTVRAGTGLEVKTFYSPR